MSRLFLLYPLGSHCPRWLRCILTNPVLFTLLKRLGGGSAASCATCWATSGAQCGGTRWPAKTLHTYNHHTVHTTELHSEEKFLCL